MAPADASQATNKIRDAQAHIARRSSFNRDIESTRIWELDSAYCWAALLEKGVDLEDRPKGSCCRTYSLYIEMAGMAKGSSISETKAVLSEVIARLNYSSTGLCWHIQFTSRGHGARVHRDIPR